MVTSLKDPEVSVVGPHLRKLSKSDICAVRKRRGTEWIGLAGDHGRVVTIRGSPLVSNQVRLDANFAHDVPPSLRLSVALNRNRRWSSGGV